MPTITISEILGNLMIIAGDILIILGLMLATLALFWAVLGKWSVKAKQQKYDLQFGVGTIFLFVFIVVIFLAKWMTADLAGFQNGVIFGFSNFLAIALLMGIVILLVITTLISFSGNTQP